MEPDNTDEWGTPLGMAGMDDDADDTPAVDAVQVRIYHTGLYTEVRVPTAGDPPIVNCQTTPPPSDPDLLHAGRYGDYTVEVRLAPGDPEPKVAIGYVGSDPGKTD